MTSMAEEPPPREFLLRPRREDPEETSQGESEPTEWSAIEAKRLLCVEKRMKSKRRFVFKSLKQELSYIRITPYHEESDLQFDQEDLLGTHLQRTLLHWQELCCSPAFVACSAKILPKCSTLAQLVLHREEIVDSLFSGVKSGDTHSLVAFFNAVAAVAKDIGGDFVLYFPSAVQAMTFCLNDIELDANQTEAMFRALASVCMVLWRSERVTLIEILKSTLEIRQHQKQYIRKFAAQAVAPVLRSSRKKNLLRAIDYLLLECTCESFNFATSQNHILEAVTLMWHYMIVIPPNTLHSKSNIMLEVLFNPSFSAKHSKHIVLVHNVITSLAVTLPQSTCKSIWAPFISVLDRFSILNHSNIDDATYCVKIFMDLCTTKFEVPFDIAGLPNFLHRYISWCLSEGTTVEQHTVAKLLGTISSRDECKTFLLLEPCTWSDIVHSFETNSLSVMLSALWRNLTSGSVTAQKMSRALLMETAHIIVFQDFECCLLLANIIERTIVTKLHDDIHIQFTQLEPGIIHEYFERQWMYERIDKVWATLRVLPYFTSPSTVHRTIIELISRIEARNNNMSVNNYSITEATILMSALEAEEVCKRMSPSVDSEFTHNLVNMVLRRKIFLPGIWLHVKELVNHQRIDLTFAEMLRRSDLAKYTSDSNRFLRLSVLRCLASANEQHPNVQTLFGVTGDIVQLFCYVNEISSDSNDVLIRSKKCVNQIMNIARRLKIERDDSTNYVAVMHMALGALRVRFKPIWEPVIHLIGVLGDRDEAALRVLEKDVLLVENELSGQKDVRKFANSCETSAIRTEIHEALIPYEKSIDHYQHMELLLEALIECSKCDSDFAISVFHRLFTLAKGCQRYIDKQYTNIVVKMLRLIQMKCPNLYERERAEANEHGKVFHKIRILAADENTEVALEALKSMSTHHLDHLSSNRLKQLSMLANPATVKRTLASVSFEHESLDTDFLPVLGQDRSEVVTLIVEIVSKYIFSKKIGSKPVKSLVLRWFASLKATEMEPFMKMLFFPFGTTGTSLLARAYSGAFVYEQHLIEAMIRNVPCHTLISFTMRLREVYQTIPEHMKRINALLFCTSFQIFNFSCDRITEDQKERTEYKSLRAVTLTLLACMVPTSSKEDLKTHWGHSYRNLKLIAEGMANECVGENEPALLRVISSIVQCQHLDGFFDETSNHVFILNITKVLRNPNVSATCRQAVLNTISCLIGNTAFTSAPSVVATLFDEIAYSMQLSFMRSFEVGKSVRTKSIVDTHTELQVLQRMTSYGRHPWNTSSFERIVDVVCSKHLHEEEYDLLLDTLCFVLDGLTLDEALRIAAMQKFAVLFVRKSSRTSRSKLLKVYALICGVHDRNIPVTLNEMNSYVEDRIDELDYGRRIDIYNKLRTKWNGETNMAKTLWIYNAVHAIHTGDLVLQNSAMALICECLKFDRAANSKIELHSCEHISIVLQEAVRLLKNRMSLVRECGIKILRYATLNHHLPQLRLLCADNEDKDVFLNLAHIQSHRRSRALRKLFASDTLQAMGSCTCMSYTVPLLLAFIRDASVDVAATAVDGLGQLSTHLTLSQFVTVVRGLLQRASSKDGTEHYYLRGAACMVDRYRTEHVFSQSYEENMSCEALISTLLPLAEARLHTARTGSTCSDTHLQINAVICASGLLSLLDDSTREQGLLRLLKMVNENLANRLQKLRDNALAALKSISSVLGARHLPLIIQSLKTGRATGFHLSVLGKAIYVVVSSCNCLTAEFASAVFAEIVTCLHSNIFLDHRNEADGKSSSLVHEAKSVYSFKTISVLVASLREHDQFFKFLRTFIRKLPSVPTRRNQNHFGLILRAFREGIRQNPHLNTTHVLYLAGSFIEEYVTFTQNSQVGAKKENTDILPEYVIKIHQFAVGLLCDCLKKMSNSGAKNDKLPSLGGIHNIVELMTRCLVSTPYDTQVGATHILNKILRDPAMCRDLPMDPLAKQIYRTLMTCKSVSDRLAQNCVSILAHTTKHRSSLPFHSKKISLLLQFAFKNLAEDAMHLRVSFLLLNAIISRRILSEEMYTLIDDLLFMISQGQTAQIRHMCCHVVIRFILTYPIGERHMEKLLRNMVASLEYSNPDGRVSVITAINGLITKLPDTSIKFHGLTFYFPLVLRMVADNNGSCSKLASRAIDSLFLRLNTERVEELLAFTDIWSSRKDRLRQAACQVLLIGFRRHAHTAFKCYSRNEDVMLDQMWQSLHNPCVDDWSWVYCLLSCFECANQYRREHAAKSLNNYSKLLDLLPSAVLYKHAWVQAASIRVLKSHLQMHYQWGDNVLTCLSIGQVSQLAKALVTNIECVRYNETRSTTSTDELFYCLSKMICTLCMQPGFERTCVDYFARIRKAASVNNSALRCSLLRMTAALLSASEAGAKSTDAVLFHAVALCQICVEECTADLNTTDVQSRSLAKDILSSVQQIMSPQEFADALNRASLR